MEGGIWQLNRHLKQNLTHIQTIYHGTDITRLPVTNLAMGCAQNTQSTLCLTKLQCSAITLHKEQMLE